MTTIAVFAVLLPAVSIIALFAIIAALRNRSDCERIANDERELRNAYYDMVKAKNKWKEKHESLVAHIGAIAEVGGYVPCDQEFHDEHCCGGKPTGWSDDDRQVLL